MFLGRKRIYKVFFSWQRDTNRNEYKIIESALNQAKKELKRLYGYEIEIDHSTLGDVGMPTIDVTILRKIEEADVFVCDITPVTSYDVKRANGLDAIKQVPNSNVLIELGYAMSAIGFDGSPAGKVYLRTAKATPSSLKYGAQTAPSCDACDEYEPPGHAITAALMLVSSVGRYTSISMPSSALV